MHEPDDLLPATRSLADRWTADAHRVDSLSMFSTSIGDGAEGVAAFREKRDPQFRASAVTEMPPFYAEWTARS